MGYWSDLFGVDDGEVTVGMILGTEPPPKRKYGLDKQSVQPRQRRADQTKKTFLICPVRGHSPTETEAVVKALEADGWEVYWPPRDTDQDDPTGFRICQANKAAIMLAGTVHFIWDGKSQGGLFDLGMAFALGKRVIPITMPELTKGKSFQNMVKEWEESSK